MNAISKVYLTWDWNWYYFTDLVNVVQAFLPRLLAVTIWLQRLKSWFLQLLFGFGDWNGGILVVFIRSMFASMVSLIVCKQMWSFSCTIPLEPRTKKILLFLAWHVLSGIILRLSDARQAFYGCLGGYYFEHFVYLSDQSATSNVGLALAVWNEFDMHVKL
jgi:hypothetical protein